MDMTFESEWKDERFWIEVERQCLYPPEAITKIQGAEELTKAETFNGARILDNGCGTGWFGKMFQDRGADVIGTDISDTLLQEASRRIPVTNASAYDLLFEDNLFDYILFSMVAHILDYPPRAFQEMARVLKPKGKAYFGIVHPETEIWDEETGLCHGDLSRYKFTEQRPWVFNLKDGRRFTKHYIHRPRSHYDNELAKLFTTSRVLQPKFPRNMTENGRYATREYLFMELIKK